MPLLAIQNQQVVVISNLIACYDVSLRENCHFISLFQHTFLVEGLENELLTLTLILLSVSVTKAILSLQVVVINGLIAHLVKIGVATTSAALNCRLKPVI